MAFASEDVSMMIPNDGEGLKHFVGGYVCREFSDFIICILKKV